MTTERPPREVGSNLLLGQLPEALATAGSVLTDDDAPAYSARDMRAYAAAQVEYALNTWMEANDKATSALVHASKEEERERWRADLKLLAEGHQAAADRTADPSQRARQMAMADAMRAAQVIWA